MCGLNWIESPEVSRRVVKTKEKAFNGTFVSVPMALAIDIEGVCGDGDDARDAADAEGEGTGGEADKGTGAGGGGEGGDGHFALGDLRQPGGGDDFLGHGEGEVGTGLSGCHAKEFGQADGLEALGGHEVGYLEALAAGSLFGDFGKGEGLLGEGAEDVALRSWELLSDFQGGGEDTGERFDDGRVMGEGTNLRIDGNAEHVLGLGFGDRLHGRGGEMVNDSVLSQRNSAQGRVMSMGLGPLKASKLPWKKFPNGRCQSAACWFFRKAWYSAAV